MDLSSGRHLESLKYDHKNLQKISLFIFLHLVYHRQRSRHVTRQQLTQLAFRPPFLGLFTKIQTSIWSEFSGQKGMPCFASSLLDSNRRQRALQISAGPIGQGDYYQPVRCYNVKQSKNTKAKTVFPDKRCSRNELLKLRKKSEKETNY